MTSGTGVAGGGGLPAAFTSFVGRRSEMAEVRRLLGSARLVTLTGAGGVGKTRLALEAAAASARAFPGGVWLVDLAPVRDPAVVVEAAAVTLGVADQGTRTVPELLAAHVAQRRLLLVLDNCEHLVEACAELAQCLLAAAPEVRILATSRETLQLTGEHVVAVAPLVQDEAVELLVQRAAAVRPGFRLTDANRAAVHRLCADLDGLPLAIELAASRLRTLAVEPVIERLEDRFALLTAGSRAARPHQRTLRAAIDWSWELCGPAERLLWSRLSVFAGSFTLEAAESVCSGEGPAKDDGLAPDEVLDVLDRLVAQSLVEHAGTERQPRYRLLETIRQYGWEHLTDRAEDQEVRRRHRDFFLALAERTHRDWFGPAQADILALLHADHSNLMAALEYPRAAAKPGPDGGYRPERDEDRQAALALPAALVHHWIAGGCLSEGRRYLERALDAAPEPTAARARALWVASQVACTQGDLGAARRFLEEAGELTERLGDAGAGAQVRGHRGALALCEGRTAEAVTLFEEAVAAHTALGDRAAEVAWRCALGIALTLCADPRAPGTSARALAETEEYGERWARARLLMALGRRAWELGEQTEAEERTRSALGMLRGFSDSIGVADMVEQLAWITASTGDPHRAGRLLGAARGLREDSGVTVVGDNPRHAEHHAHGTARVRGALGAAGYDEALAAGAALDGADQVIAYALGAAAGTGPEADPSPAPASGLTRREEQVAELVARGMTNRRIAAELVLSPRTVDNHVNRILTKLGFSSRAQVAAWWAVK
ncbi:LuxR C-terminal-related transcriptional regulator [Streptomyces sp. NPDC005811]|uniref:LuxR C-terminal-related transcriptional regulator n=1 Tax=Streptomyces sp. NPDC005811 TaxID=3154565 RepID=UPI0033DD9341